MPSIVVYGATATTATIFTSAAVSINCLAEMLRDPADELIFVDHNFSQAPAIVAAPGPRASPFGARVRRIALSN
jgi:hypothetical protein